MSFEASLLSLYHRAWAKDWTHLYYKSYFRYSLFVRLKNGNFNYPPNGFVFLNYVLFVHSHVERARESERANETKLQKVTDGWDSEREEERHLSFSGTRVLHYSCVAPTMECYTINQQQILSIICSFGQQNETCTARWNSVIRHSAFAAEDKISFGPLLFLCVQCSVFSAHQQTRAGHRDFV